MKEYMPRILDSLLDTYLKAFGGVLIKGPKWCGKTTTGQQKAKSVLKLQDTSKQKEYKKIIDVEPGILLEGKHPRLIDEWQSYPILWDAIRCDIDNRGGKGYYILTGSALPKDDATMHTGTGRIARLIMRPMSLYESNDSTGKISLAELFYNDKININGMISNLSIENLIEVTCRGGWPASIGEDIDTSLLIARQYVNSICEDDMNRVGDSQKDPRRVAAILKSYARNISTLASNKAMLKDVNANDVGISEPTLYSYLNALTRLFVIEGVKAWCPAIRSASAMRATEKKEFIDPSIAVAALGLTPKKLLYDLNTFGFLFENLCIRDLRIYSSALGGEISYYHDRSGLECDCVLHLGDGNFALIEFKLGSKEIEEGALHLLKLKQMLIDSELKAPTLMIIMTGGQLSYRRNDGVLIIPVGCLKD